MTARETVTHTRYAAFAMDAKEANAVTKLNKLMRDLKACDEARLWANDFATLADAWAACERPDWMLWLVAELDQSYSPRLRLTACALARTALEYVPAGEDRPRLAIETAERFARGESTEAELAAARTAAWAAVDAARAVGSASGAAARAAAWAAGAALAAGNAWAASWAAVDAARAVGFASGAAARAALAAAWTATDAGDAAGAAGAARAAQCRIIREHIPNPEAPHA